MFAEGKQLSKKPKNSRENSSLIFHIDVNSAYLSWEAVYRMKCLGVREDLRCQVSAVAGDTTLRQGIILAKSIPAKARGVSTGDSIFEARRKCPSLLLVPPHYALYEKCSLAFLKILKEYSPAVEPYSIDEAFVDMSGTGKIFGEPLTAAREMKERIKQELGFTVNIGISTNKVLAKMASDFEKPDKVHTLYPWEVEEKLWPLSVSRLFFAGTASQRKLKNMGIFTIRQLAETDPEILKAHMGKQGELLWTYARGIDPSLIQPLPPPNKGYGNSITLPWDVKEREIARKVLLSLCETLGARLRAHKVQARVFCVSIKTWDFSRASHQRKCPWATSLTQEIYDQTVLLFDQLWKGEPIRHLGVHLSGISREQDFFQESLFALPNREKWQRAEAAVDQIRRRYGGDSVKRAVFLNTGMEHMAGGISREKYVPQDKRAISRGNCL